MRTFAHEKDSRSAMRYIRYAVCFGIAVIACLIVSSSASAEQIIRCRSNDYQYNHCPTREHGQIRLSQQISKSACIEGRTWGYDRRGVWVDQGCDAKFRVAARRRNRDYRDDRHDRHDQNDRHDRYDRDNSGSRGSRHGKRLVCRSDGFAYNHCRSSAVGRGSKVRLAKQISKTRCIQNKIWGTDERGIWVDRGCEAEFQILPRRNNRVTGGKDTLRCSSKNYSYEHCRADTRRGVQLSRQLSQAACTQGKSWGHDRRGVWVDQGCSAQFQLGHSARNPYGNPAQNPGGNALGQALENLLAPPR